MSGRDYALAEIDRRRLPRWPAGVIRGKGGEVPSDSRDRGLGEQILIGVIKNVLRLQYLIEHYSKRSLKSIDPLAQKILAVALYQMKFLERVPARAAVDEAVEQ